jgi:response regulator RpfG family c-di-GMP phosphodiesterase
MDGMEATEIIRKKMKLDLPIIALTANALKSDKEKYLEIGMNEYISKPFNPLELFNTIGHVLNLTSPISTTNLIVDSIKSNISRKMYDLSGLEKIASGDDAFFMKMISLFLSQSQEHLDKIREFAQNGNIEQIKAVIHKMKPSVNILGINSIKEIFETIEQLQNQPENNSEIQKVTVKLESVLLMVVEQLQQEYEYLQ